MRLFRNLNCWKPDNLQSNVLNGDDDDVLIWLMLLLRPQRLDIEYQYVPNGSKRNETQNRNVINVSSTERLCFFSCVIYVETIKPKKQ